MTGPFEMRPTAATCLAARWRHRAERMESLLDAAGVPADAPERATVATLRLCADEVEPAPVRQAVRS